MTRFAAALAALLLPLAVVTATAEIGSTAPDLTALEACFDSAWKADAAGWAGFAFDRRVVLRDLDRHGREKRRTERLFRMTPDDGGFDERLLSENGRPATADEVREFRRKANFSKNYRGAARLEFQNPLGEDLALMPLLRQQELRFVGRDELDGVPCHRLTFDAGTVKRRASAENQLLNSVTGSVCVAVDGCHTLSLELETVRPIQQSIARIDYLRVEVAGQQVAGGEWVPAAIDAQFDFEILGRHLRRFTSYRYSNYRRLAETGEPGG